MAAEYCLTVAVTKEFKERVHKQAKLEGHTISSLVKRLLEVYLSSLEDTTPSVDFAKQIILLQQTQDTLLQQNHVLTTSLNQTMEDVEHLQKELTALKEKVQNQ